MMTFSNAADWPKFSYPPTRKEDVVDDYHGTKVADPYRWLEDDNAAETKSWVEAENRVTNAFLDGIPQRKQIRERLTKLWNYERFGAPFKRGGRYFWTYNSGLQNQRVLYVAERLDAEPRVLLDPNSLSADGTVSLTDYVPSEDGKLLVYGLSRAGSDWEEFHVREVETGKDRGDLLKWVKFSGASWMKDGTGFFYSRYDEPKSGDVLKGKNEFQKLYFHKLGTPQGGDALVYERKDHADWGFNGRVTDDGRYLIIHVRQGTDPKNRVFYKDLTVPDAKVVELLNDFDAAYGFIDNVGPVFLFHTDLDAPRYRVIAVDTRAPVRAHWREWIPQAAEKLEDVSYVGGRLIASYLKDARSEVKLFGVDVAGPDPMQTQAKPLGELKLPGIGTVGGFGGRAGDTETFFSYTSFTEPGAIYRMDVAKADFAVWRKPKVDFDSAAYETEQVFVQSKDGTRVPMFITHKRGLKLDGSTPTILYGYGGFNISLTPAFSISRAVWLEMGGIFAVANLRGGGEYGADWHLAGVKLKKQNVFDDFIAAAEWLVKNNYTRPEKLAIQGGSNGGLLVGAVMTQRPELIGAALPAVGVMDMLRFHKFTIGWAWKSDYGSSENAEDFKALHAYSPYHNLKPGTRYPATLVTTADHDDRVVPAHSFKFAARLQECQAAGGPPVMIRIETSAGHGGGTALKKVIEETTDAWAFLVKVFAMP
ncbi:MAG: prolyl oligopeptidase family serine peptidase [Chthoniobacteraceae bacterium]